MRDLLDEDTRRSAEHQRRERMRAMAEARATRAADTMPKLDTPPPPTFTREEAQRMIATAIDAAVAVERERSQQILIGVITRLQDDASAATKQTVESARQLIDRVIDERFASRDGTSLAARPATH
jgi:hypothetical protein